MLSDIRGIILEIFNIKICYVNYFTYRKCSFVIHKNSLFNFPSKKKNFQELILPLMNWHYAKKKHFFKELTKLV